MSLIFILEKFVWLSVPIVFLLIISILLKRFSKKIPVWPFYFLTLLSVSHYLLFGSWCAGIGFGQLVCTAKISLAFNIYFFLYVSIVILVFTIIFQKYITHKTNHIQK